MVVVFVLTLAGLVADPRVILGAPVWLKPAKFAISTAIYAMTFAWIFTYLAAWPRLTRIVGATTAAVLVLEVALIAVQAARGTTSHFNVGTPLDGAIFPRWASRSSSPGPRRSRSPSRCFGNRSRTDLSAGRCVSACSSP